MKNLQSHSHSIQITGARQNNLKNISLSIEKGKITMITGVSGSGKSSLAFDTILNESYRIFFNTLSHYSRQFLDFNKKPLVTRIQGLPPAIGLSQRETKPSSRATLASFTDIGELLGVLYANFGEQFCPNHDLPVEMTQLSMVMEKICNEFQNQTLTIFAPLIENKVGTYKDVMNKVAEKGYMNIWLDGSITPVIPTPKLDASKKHTIKIVVDVIKIKDGCEKRLERALNLAFEEAKSVAQYSLTKSKSQKSFDFITVSNKAGCPQCGFAWPNLDSRYFSSNSLGRCEQCNGMGYLVDLGDAEDDLLDQDVVKQCSYCMGVGLDNKLNFIRIDSKSILDLHGLELENLLEFLKSILQDSLNHFSKKLVLEQIIEKVVNLEKLSLSYLKPCQRLAWLSNGEYQRLRLSTLVSTNLQGILYVIDEPSQGLHRSELKKVVELIKNLRDQGNTIVLVDHDLTLAEEADWIIDLGPGGGENGGKVLAQFSPKQASKFAKFSETANFMVKPTNKRRISKKSLSNWIEIKDLCRNNLKIETLRIPLQGITTISGVSGAGKNSLIVQTVYKNLKNKVSKDKRNSKLVYCSELKGHESLISVDVVDRKPLAKSSSIPLTFLKLFPEIKKLFAATPDAQIMGVTDKDFSIHREGGRCEECKGKGYLLKKYKFLMESEVLCGNCDGRRFIDRVLNVKYLGVSLDEIFDFSINQAVEFFKNHKRILKVLKSAQDLELGYIKLGQPLSTLSGGEAQRMKLVPILSKRMSKENLIIIDEPTIGLHQKDAVALLSFLEELREIGTTILIIENNEEFIANSDWNIHLGPGSGKNGGQLIYQGVPSTLVGR